MQKYIANATYTKITPIIIMITNKNVAKINYYCLLVAKTMLLNIVIFHLILFNCNIFLIYVIFLMDCLRLGYLKPNLICII